MEGKGIKLLEIQPGRTALSSVSLPRADGRPVPQLPRGMQFCISSSCPFPQTHDVIKKIKDF